MADEKKIDTRNAAIKEKYAKNNHLSRKLDCQNTSLRCTIEHAPRAAVRIMRWPFVRLAFHKRGEPRGWLRKVVFRKNGTPHRIFERVLFHKNGDPRSTFIFYLFANRTAMRPSLLPNKRLAFTTAERPLDFPQASSGAVLIAADFLPLFDQQSGGLRLKTLIDMVGALGRPMIFASTSQRSELPGVLRSSAGRTRYEKVLRNAGVNQFTYGEDELNALLDDDKTVLSHAFLSFPAVAKRLMPLIRAKKPDAKVIYDMVDFHALRMAREAALTGNPDKAKDATEMEELETKLANEADVTIAVSNEEKKAMLELAPMAVVDVLPNIFGLPNGEPPGPENRHDILFVGGFWHKPNSDAVRHFVRTIFPLIRARKPDCRFTIAGSNPGDDVVALANESGVEVLGYVPDLKPLYDASRVSVAPLRYGAGVKGKVGEAMASGVPVVTTSIGAEGMLLGAQDHIFVADEPQTFADMVVELLDDNELWRATQAKGIGFIKEHFSIAALNAKVRELFRD